MSYYNVKFSNVLSIIIILLLTSCSTEESAVSVFSVDIVADSFVPEGGDKTITLTSNIPWSASSSDDWLTVSPTKGTGGTTVTLSATNNNTPATRRGIVTLTPEIGEPVKISVSQTTRYEFQVDRLELTFLQVSDTLEVSLTTESSWELSSVVDWLTVSPGNGEGSSTLAFIASQNNTHEHRQTVVTLTPDVGDPIEISVTQNGVLFFTDVSKVSFNHNPGEKYIKLMSNVPWEAVSNYDWLTINPVNGVDSKEHKITLTVQRNDAEEDRAAVITLMPEVGGPITVLVSQLSSNHASESIKYAASNKKGSGTGDTESNAADFMSENFWKQINNELGTKSLEVKLLPGDYSRAYSNKGFILKSLGNAENTLTISGNSNVIFDTGESSSQIASLFEIQNCENIILRDIHFTGNGKLNYVLLIKSIKNLPASKNIIIENCTWKDMFGVVYGATGCHSIGTTNIIYKNCSFERIGIDGSSHMMYHAHSASRINIDNCHFEDCKGDYVRFRDNVDFVVVKNCMFIHNDKFDTRHSPFLAVPLFNSRGNVGDEYFATNYAFHDNKFISKPGVRTDFAIYFGHWGFSPPEYNYLLTAQEAAILLNGSYEEKSNLLQKNLGLYVEKIRMSNNSFSGNITYNLALRSFAFYGAVSRGWEGTRSILDLVSKSKEPFEWEK